MKYVEFSHFNCLWPPSSHKEHCKSKDAKYWHLEDVEVKWQFLTILRAISEHSKWPKGSIPHNIVSMMYAEHVLRANVDWTTFHTEGFGAIGQGLLVKQLLHIPYILVPEWFRNDPKFYVDPRVQEGTAWAVRGAQRADDALALLEWESFAGLVALVVEGVGMVVDARMEALR